jgi:phenylacetate-CoA ligase
MNDWPTDRSAIAKQQLAMLRDLIDAITPGNAFYAKRLEAAGITAANLDSLEMFSAKMPFTTKQDLVEDQISNPPYGTTLSFPLGDYTRYHQTSGTTTSPIRWLDTPDSWQWMLENWGFVYEGAGIKADDVVMFTFSFGPFLGFWTAFECATQRGYRCLPGGGLSTEGRLRMLVANEATVLCCTPTYAIRLAEAAGEFDIDLTASKVRTVIVAGEPGGSVPAVRQRIESLWCGANVIDHHGMTEIGPVSYQTVDQPSMLHLIESSYYVEIVNPDTGVAVSPGEVGELVLTTLGRIGSPLLRYRTGDLVKQTSEPVTGIDRQDIALDGGILGRVDDMVVVRSVNVFPSAVEQVVRLFEGVGEYQVHVHESRAMTELTMKLEPAEDCDSPAALAERLQEKLRAALAIRVPVELVKPGTLPRFEMKAKRWVKM